jgi:hypothetical protein
MRTILLARGRLDASAAGADLVIDSFDALPRAAASLNPMVVFHAA